MNNGLYNGVFRAAVSVGIERFVYVSSSMVFENATKYPTPESYVTDTPIPTSAYGFSKLTGEVYCRAAHDEFGLPYTICRPFNAYGPGEMPEDEPGIAHMVPDVIKKVLGGQRPLQIFGDGTQTRTITHIDDIADGIVTAMASPKGLNEDFNVSAGEEMTVAEICKVIWEACGEDPPSSSSSTCRRSRWTSFAAGRTCRRPVSSLAGRPGSASAKASPDGRLAPRSPRRLTPGHPHFWGSPLLCLHPLRLRGTPPQPQRPTGD
jgi:nucleoside-diphosphate-sugar epimerase